MVTSLSPSPTVSEARLAAADARAPITRPSRLPTHHDLSAYNLRKETSGVFRLSTFTSYHIFPACSDVCYDVVHIDWDSTLPAHRTSDDSSVSIAARGTVAVKTHFGAGLWVDCYFSHQITVPLLSVSELQSQNWELDPLHNLYYNDGNNPKVRALDIVYDCNSALLLRGLGDYCSPEDAALGLTINDLQWHEVCITPMAFAPVSMLRHAPPLYTHNRASPGPCYRMTYVVEGGELHAERY